MQYCTGTVLFTCDIPLMKPALNSEMDGDLFIALVKTGYDIPLALAIPGYSLWMNRCWLWSNIF